MRIRSTLNIVFLIVIAATLVCCDRRANEEASPKAPTATSTSPERRQAVVVTLSKIQFKGAVNEKLEWDDFERTSADVLNRVKASSKRVRVEFVRTVPFYRVHELFEAFYRRGIKSFWISSFGGLERRGSSVTTGTNRSYKARIVELDSMPKQYTGLSATDVGFSLFLQTRGLLTNWDGCPEDAEPLAGQHELNSKLIPGGIDTDKFRQTNPWSHPITDPEMQKARKEMDSAFLKRLGLAEGRGGQGEGVPPSSQHVLETTFCRTVHPRFHDALKQIHTPSPKDGDSTRGAIDELVGLYDFSQLADALVEIHRIYSTERKVFVKIDPVLPAIMFAELAETVWGIEKGRIHDEDPSSEKKRGDEPFFESIYLHLEGNTHVVIERAEK